MYGHWDITRMTMAGHKNGIASLQTYVINTFFYYLQLTEVHGNKNPDINEIKNITVPDGKFISAVEFVIDRNGNLIGVGFYFSDSTNSGFVGIAPVKSSGHTVIRYDVPAKQEIIGFFGYENEVSIMALGLLVVEQNDSKFYYT